MTRPHKKGRVGRILVEFGLKTERSNPSFGLDLNTTQTRILTRTQIRSGTQANKKKLVESSWKLGFDSKLGSQTQIHFTTILLVGKYTYLVLGKTLEKLYFLSTFF